MLERFGVDLADWWRKRRWVALLDLIDGLPEASRFKEAVLNTPEVADYLARQQDDSKEWSPPFAEYDLHARLDHEILHAIRGLETTIVALLGKKARKPVSFPGPTTELDRALERAEKEWASSLLSRYGFDPAQYI